MKTGLRLNKYLADRGIAARREADRMIEAGLVKVNGKTAVLGERVDEKDKVEVTPEKRNYTYLAYYKGRGIISHSPNEAEISIADRLKQDYKLQNISPVGRLDKDSEGLMILSDDGRITSPLLDSQYEHEKEYEVTVDKDVTSYLLKRLSDRVVIEGYKTKKAKARPHKSDTKKFYLTLIEGKKHQIRRMCAALGYQVKYLKRIRIMNIGLDKLKANQFRKITGLELKTFLKDLGIQS
jgi:23S rRNA pseudouridine2604 synthase